MTLLAGHFLSPLAFRPGPLELIVVLLIVLLLFGRRLPGLARSLGQGISSFKRGLNDPLTSDDDKTDAKKELPAPSDKV